MQAWMDGRDRDPLFILVNGPMDGRMARAVNVCTIILDILLWNYDPDGAMLDRRKFEYIRL